MSENSTTVHRNYTRADLEALNDERAKTLIPAMTILALLMLVGVVGNSLVCYIFCFKLKSSTQNFLIVCLAVLDLLSCVTGLPSVIVELRFYYILVSVSFCKIIRFFNTFCANGSILTLVVISVDRYRKICLPLHRQMRMSHVRLSLLPVFGGALFSAWPAFFTYGLRTTETYIPGLFGQDCSIPDNMSATVFPLLYNCILLLCFIILAASLIIIYAYVIQETKQHSRFLEKNSDYNNPCSVQHNSDKSHSRADAAPADQSPAPADPSPAPADPSPATADPSPAPAGPAPAPADPATVYPQSSIEAPAKTVQFYSGSNTTVATIVKIPLVYPKPINASTLVDSTARELEINYSQSESTTYGTISSCNETGSTTLYFTDSSLPSKSESIQSPPNTSQPAKRSSLASDSGVRKREPRVVLFNPNQNTRRRRKSKSTIIAFTVSLVFIISFLPHLCLQVTTFLMKGFDLHLHGAGLNAFNLFIRSYYINCVSNPFIYAALNVQFSGEVKNLLKRILMKS